MSATDLTFLELQTYTYQELKSVITSEAYPTATIQRLLNEGYFDVFNSGRKNVYVREGSVSFATIPDTNLTIPVVAGDVVINVTSTALFPTAGTILIGSSFISYTNTTATTFTGCTNVGVGLGTELVVRANYNLEVLAPLIDEQQLRAMEIDNMKYYRKDVEDFIALDNLYDRSFAIFDGNLVLPFTTVTQRGYIQYFKRIVPMALADDTPALIPNSFRQMLSFYAAGRALILDDKRTGWELYYNYNPTTPSKSSGMYFEWLRNFYAKYGRRTDMIRRYNGSVYD